MTKTLTLLSPIVGIQFRDKLARQELFIAPSNTPLILDPEPDNPYDPNAIKVLLSAGADLLWVGYIISKNNKHLGSYNSNVEFLAVMQSGPNWKSYLTFSPTGQPLVKLEYTP